MDIRNTDSGHIGLQTIDRNVSHTHWPCVSHPPELSCAEAIRLVGKRGFRTLPAQRQIPQREWVDRR